MPDRRVSRARLPATRHRGSLRADPSRPVRTSCARGPQAVSERYASPFVLCRDACELHVAAKRCRCDVTRVRRVAIARDRLPHRASTGREPRRGDGLRACRSRFATRRRVVEKHSNSQRRPPWRPRLQRMRRRRSRASVRGAWPAARGRNLTTEGPKSRQFVRLARIDEFVSFLACSSPCRHPERLLPSGACDAPAGSTTAAFLSPDGESGISLRISHIPAFVCVVVVAFGVTSAATADNGPVASKQAEAQSIIAQISSLETQVSVAIERWNQANVKLVRIDERSEALSLRARCRTRELQARAGRTREASCRPVHVERLELDDRGVARSIEPRRSAQPHRHRQSRQRPDERSRR